MIELFGPSAGTYDSLWVSNTSRVTDTGDLNWNVLDSATSGWLCYVPVTASPGQCWSIFLKLACPTGPAVNLQFVWIAVDGSGTDLLHQYSAAQLCGPAGTTFTAITDPLPTGTVAVRLQVALADNAAGVGRKLAVTGRSAKLYSSPDAIIGAAIERPLNREGNDSASGLVITGGPMGTLEGTITYLCSTWSEVLAIDSLHKTTDPITVSGADASGLNGMTYYSTGRLRYSTERTLPGVATRWLAQVPIKAGT